MALKKRLVMNSRQHAGIGLLVFFGYSIVLLRVADPAILSWYGLFAVLIGSLIPDLFEPATSSRHRSFFHSMGTLSVTAIAFGLTGIIAIVISFFSSFLLFYLASCFFLGYVFHLLADSITPAGLPR
jgi:membrane-bound metal-dependent hydrolase YbcI (DUF457 family)